MLTGLGSGLMVAVEVKVGVELARGELLVILGTSEVGAEVVCSAWLPVSRLEHAPSLHRPGRGGTERGTDECLHH